MLSKNLLKLIDERNALIESGASKKEIKLANEALAEPLANISPSAIINLDMADFLDFLSHHGKLKTEILEGSLEDLKSGVKNIKTINQKNLLMCIKSDGLDLEETNHLIKEVHSKNSECSSLMFSLEQDDLAEKNSIIIFSI